jgi:predicted dehydrogenase
MNRQGTEARRDLMDRIGIAVLGAGYWGPNLVRNVALNPDTELRWVCDLDLERATKLAGTYGRGRATASLDEVLDDPGVHAVAVATPASTHAALGIKCLRAGKHVLIEKPLAESVAAAEEMLAVAEQEQRILMCDHTYCYTPAVQHIAAVIGAGELGDVLFIDSVRINLGLVQPDVNVLWDLAPHDLSILDFVLPEERRVKAVAARGADPIGAGQACVGHLTLDLGAGSLAHVHVNWLSPTKIRTMIIGGSRRTLVFDDLNPTQRIAIYDRSVDLDIQADRELRRRNQVSYRIGDMVAPALRDAEALGGVINELVAGIRGERAPMTDGAAGLRVLQALEAADESLAADGASIELPFSTEKVAV